MIRSMRYVAPLLIAAGCGAVSGQQTLRVPGQYASIQSAIASARPSDTILVGPGTYRETIDFLGKAITVRSAGGPRNTVIDANGNGSVAVFRRGETRSAVLEGFTLTGGAGTFDQSYQCGGGVFCLASAPTIRGNVIIGNSAQLGGGVYATGANTAPAIVQNTIVGNTARWGGGFYQWQVPASPASSMPTLIYQNTIEENNVTNGGGAIGVQYSPCAEIRRNLIARNTAPRGAGIDLHGVRTPARLIEGNRIIENVAEGMAGLQMTGSRMPVIANNVIARNRATRYSTGGLDWYGTGGVIVNNTIVDNTAASGAGGVRIRGASQGAAYFLSNIVWNNGGGAGPSELVVDPGSFQPFVQYCDIGGGWNGVGNFNADPRFIDAARGDYHLRADSPCLDAGAPGSLPFDDFEADPRIVGGSIDVGADEFHPHTYAIGDAKPGAIVRVRVVGAPGNGVVLGVSLGRLVRPKTVPGLSGHLSLDPRYLVAFPLPAFGAAGFREQSFAVPSGLPPVDVFAQAWVGRAITNLAAIRIE